ncbi:unnamed protein product [Phytomonas sp. EM1]|nr:unnamed protein product [Phytomonas sp. EM1]|eukprot:CCW65669.1 unnamed protein product [Phytomonas sp. isolate EM1]
MLRRCQRVLMDGQYMNRVYELRMDQIKPAKYEAVKTIFMKEMPKRPEAGVCLGFWDVQVGAFNQFVVIWQFKSLTDRSECLKRLHEDKEWQRNCIEPMKPLLRFQSNMLMRMIYRESNVSRLSYHYLLQFTDAKDVELPQDAILAATFQVVVGSLEGKYVHLIKNLNPDGILPLTPKLGNSSLVMGPARCAPIMGCIWR